MMVSRRSLLSSSIALAAMDKALAAASRFIDLTYSAGRLSWPGGAATAACGRAGVRMDKREGDGASPEGRFVLLPGFYRADRIALPPSHLAMTALQPSDGWIDDPADPSYNRLVSLPYPAHHEEMWRADGLQHRSAGGRPRQRDLPAPGAARFRGDRGLHRRRPRHPRRALGPARAGQHDHDPTLTSGAVRCIK